MARDEKTSTTAVLDHPPGGRTPALEPFEAGPYPVIRVNPTPAHTLCAPRSPEDSASLLRLRALRDDQSARAEELGDLLYAEAPAVDHELRNQVVLPLRRAVHNGAAPPKGLDRARVSELGCSPLALDWVRRQDEIERLRGALGTGYDEALADERGRLRQVLGDESLRRSLSLSSELLPSVARDYAETPWDNLRKSTRKSEASLLRYAVRAGCKTSPYSRYTAVGFLGNERPTDAIALQSDVEVNRALLRRLEAGLRQRPVTRARLRVHAAAGLTRRGDHFVTRGDRDQLGAEAARVAEQYGEAQLTVPASAPAVALLQWLAEREHGTATFEELAALIERKVGGADHDAAEGFVARLLDCGVLAACPIVDDATPDPLRKLAAWVDESTSHDDGDTAFLATASSRFTRVADLADEFGGAGAEQRVDLLRAARQERDTVLADLRDPVDARPPPEPIWYEDTRIVDGTPTSTAGWSTVLDDCRDLLGILCAFDEQHVFSRVLTSRFVGQFGRGGSTRDLDTLGEIFLHAYGDALQVTEGFEHGLIEDDPVISDLVALRRRIVQPLVEQLLATDARAGPVRLDREWVDQVAREMPAWVRRTPSSHSVFLQPLGGDPPTAAVLNKIYNGWGNYISRFLTAAPEQVVERVRAHARGLLPPEDVMAELRPVQGFNANIHPLLGDVDLDFDARGGEGRIPMDRLVLQHDTELDRIQLWDSHTGHRIHPFYLGFLIPYYLPSSLVPLTAMAGSGSVMFEPQVSADRDPRVDREQVREYPRVVFSSLVLARARWHVPAMTIPQVERGESEASYFVRLNEWRTSVGLPDEVFLHPPAPELDPGKVNDYFGTYLGNRKPQYVGFLSRLHVRHLSRLLVQQPGVDVVFEEALPGPAQAFPIGETAHATEMVAEFYRPADNDRRARS